MKVFEISSSPVVLRKVIDMWLPFARKRKAAVSRRPLVF
jgi:hypothetical protein